MFIRGLCRPGPKEEREQQAPGQFPFLRKMCASTKQLGSCFPFTTLVVVFPTKERVVREHTVRAHRDFQSTGVSQRRCPHQEEAWRTARSQKRERQGAFKVPLGGLGKWDQGSNTYMTFSSKSTFKLGSITPLEDENRETQRDKGTCLKSHRQ